MASARSFFSFVVLVLERLQPLGIRDLEAAILGLPFVEGRAADPVPATQIGGLRPGLLLPQDSDDLLFREPACLHVHPPVGDGLYPSSEEIPGLRSNGEIFTTLREAQVLIEAWRRHYNTVRPHSSLGYRPPAPEAILPPATALPYAPLRPDQMLADRGRILT